MVQTLRRLFHGELFSDKEEKELAVEVTKSTYQYYAMTLRKTKTPKDRPLDCQHYEERIKELETLGIDVEDVVYEYTSGLHCHGLALVPENYNFKKVRKRGWNVKFDQIYDYLGWIAYMMKDQSKEGEAEHAA